MLKLVKKAFPLDRAIVIPTLLNSGSEALLHLLCISPEHANCGHETSPPMPEPPRDLTLLANSSLVVAVTSSGPSGCR